MKLFQTATSIIVDQIIKFYDNDGSKVKKKKKGSRDISSGLLFV